MPLIVLNTLCVQRYCCIALCFSMLLFRVRCPLIFPNRIDVLLNDCAEFYRVLAKILRATKKFSKNVRCGKTVAMLNGLSQIEIVKNEPTIEMISLFSVGSINRREPISINTFEANIFLYLKQNGNVFLLFVDLCRSILRLEQRLNID